jgi:hypothetical protein
MARIVAPQLTPTNAVAANQATAAAATATLATTQLTASVTQSLAESAAIAGIVSLPSLAAMTGADGYYRAMDTGYVYQRSGGVNTRRNNLEAMMSVQRPYLLATTDGLGYSITTSYAPQTLTATTDGLGLRIT